DPLELGDVKLPGQNIGIEGPVWPLPHLIDRAGQRILAVLADNAPKGLQGLSSLVLTAIGMVADPIIPPKIRMKSVFRGKDEISEPVKKGRAPRAHPGRPPRQSVARVASLLRPETPRHHSRHGKNTRNTGLSKDGVGEARLSIDQGRCGPGEEEV